MEPKRTDHTQIPGSSEIDSIVAAEAERPKLVSKLNARYADFASIIKLYDLYKMDVSVFRDGFLTSHQILDAGAKDIPYLIQRIMHDDQNRQALDEVYDYLAEEDKPEPAQFIFVFGSKANYRAEKAIELYKNNLGQKIIFSGHMPSYTDKQQTPEAKLHAELAIKSGVPQENIIVEPKSITIPDNVRRTLNMLDQKSIAYNSFILVNSPYSQRRGWCVFKKYTEDSVKITRCNSLTKTEYDREHWFKNKEGIAMVIGEYFKLRNAVSFNDA